MAHKIKFRVNPWETSEELLTVYTNLFQFSSHHDDIESHQAVVQSLSWARDQLTIWSTRCSGNYGSEFEVTRCLVSAIIEDKKRTYLKINAMVSGDLHSVFCFALVRFYNLICNYEAIGENGKVLRVSTKGGQQEQRKPIAEKLGLPPWIIECRHEICHGSLPRMVLLRQAVFICLRWLEKHFWKPLVDEATSELKVTDHLTAIEVCCKRLMIAVEKEDETNARKELYQHLLTSSSLTCSIIAKTLIAESRAEISMTRDESDVFKILGNATKFQPLIRFVVKHDHLPHLLYSLLEDFPGYASQVWFDTILELMLLNDKSSPLKTCFKRKKTHETSADSKLMWFRLLYKMAKNPNKKTAKFMDQLSTELKYQIPKSKFNVLLKLVKLYTGDVSTDEGFVEETTEVKTVEKLKAALGDSNNDVLNDSDVVMTNIAADPGESHGKDEGLHLNGVIQCGKGICNGLENRSLSESC